MMAEKADSVSDCSDVETNDIELGFVEPCQLWRLKSVYFPSKVGGFPAWLNLKDLPSPELLSCNKCGDVCTYLCQVYAPGEDQSFHRALFVFVCRNSGCYGSEECSDQCFVALRCQLPRNNPFYAFEPPVMDPNFNGLSSEDYGSKCAMCGIRGDKRCGRCKSVSYCGKTHQVYHWKHGHKKQCKDIVATGTNTVDMEDGSPLLFPEYEIVTEIEEIDVNEKTEEECLEEYREFLKTEKTMTGISRDLSRMAATDQDKQFTKFRHITSFNPKQVIRYGLGMEPLWVSSDNIPHDEDIPVCSCGKKRQFEFQVMPQMLNYLEMDNEKDGLDWGTLVVFTCSANCNPYEGYHKEFIWKQNFSMQDL